MSAVPAALPRTAGRTLSTRLALGGIVAAGTVLQMLLARLVVMPTVFPDEYIYSQLGRSLATTGQLRVRGVSAHFLPVLEPILTAPMWLAGSVETSLRLIQLENAFAFSLAAIPAYLIARRVGAGTGLALGVAALAVAGPQGMFTAMIMSEPFAYPLALGVVAAALAAIERPSLRAQALVLVLSGLAAFDRLQLAVLPLCAMAAIAAIAVRERRLRAALREQRLLVGVVAGVAVVALVVALVHGFGYYRLAVRATGVLPALRVGGADVLVVLLATGAALAPSAVVGLALAVAKPRSRAELAFGTLTAILGAALIVQCVLWGDVVRVQERYLGYLLPLLAVAFALRWTRRERRFTAELGVAAALAAVLALVPLDGYSIDSSHSLAPTLYAFQKLQSLLHSASSASAVFALAGTALAALGAVAVVSRRGAPVVVAASLAGSVALLVGAATWSAALARDGRANYLPADKAWVDAGDAGRATMLVVGRPFNASALATLFWNPSIEHVVRTPGSSKVDWLDDPFVTVAADGSVALGGKAVTGAVVVSSSPASTVVLQGARFVRGWGSQALWRPTGTARLAAVMGSRFPNGRVLRSGPIDVWGPTERLAGWIELRAGVPAPLRGARVVLSGAGGRASATIGQGHVRTLRVAACGRGPWSGGFNVSTAYQSPRGWTSPVLSVARYVPDPRACR